MARAAFVTYQEDSQPTGSFQSIATNIRNDRPTNNFGRDPMIFTGAQGGSTGRVRGVFAYDLRAAGGLSAGVTITDVSFALTIQDTDGSSVSRNVTLEMHPLTGTITEGTGLTSPATTNDVSWNNRTTGTAWTTAGGDLSSTVLASVSADPTAMQAGTVLTFSGSGASNPLVQAAQAALDNPTSGVLEFVIKLPNGSSAGQEQGADREVFIFQSDDNRNNNLTYDPSVAPTLTITTAPEPASAVLLSVAVAGALLRRRRRRAPATFSASFPT